MSEVVTECTCGQLPALEPQWTVRHAEAYASVLPAGAHVWAEEPDAVYPHLVRGQCSCGWRTAGYMRGWLALGKWEAHAAEGTKAALTLAACSDPKCPACLGQIAANEEAADMAGEPHPDAVYGACGTEGCLRCRPLYDADNKPIPGTVGGA